MKQIQKPKGSGPLDITGRISMPACEVPSFLFLHAVDHGIDKNILFKTSGGFGDYVCSEPAIRFAVNNFKDSKISISTSKPELYQHLKFERVYNSLSETPDESKYFVFNNHEHVDSLRSEYICHALMNSVDYAAINMFRFQLPIKDREICLKPSAYESSAAELLNPKGDIIIHAGKGMQSKTFPKEWWDGVLSGIVSSGLRPVLIGQACYSDRGTVGVDTHGCLDLREQLSMMQTTAVLQRACVLITNDSLPLHLAASGDAWVGCISTIRHPDHIFHWRHGQWSWRMENLSHGGLWETMNVAPNNGDGIEMGTVPEKDLLSWLPDPKMVAAWGINKCEQSY